MILKVGKNHPVILDDGETIIAAKSGKRTALKLGVFYRQIWHVQFWGFFPRIDHYISSRELKGLHEYKWQFVHVQPWLVFLVLAYSSQPACKIAFISAQRLVKFGSRLGFWLLWMGDVSFFSTDDSHSLNSRGSNVCKYGIFGLNAFLIAENAQRSLQNRMKIFERSYVL